MFKLLLRLEVIVLLGVICQSRAAEKHDLALVVEATQGMSSTLNDLYSTFEFLQSRRSALHKVISSYLVATFDLEGSADVVQARNPRRVANALPVSLSVRSPNCRAQVFTAVIEALRRTGNCPDVYVVTQSLPNDEGRLTELQNMADEKNAKITILTVHNCEGDQSVYDALSKRTGGQRVHFVPHRRRNLRSFLSSLINPPEPVILLDTVEESREIPIRASRDMTDLVVHVRCPQSTETVDYTMRLDGIGIDDFASNKVGDSTQLKLQSPEGGGYMLHISGASGSCRVVATAASDHIGAGWHQIPSVGSSGLSNYILLTGNADDIVSITSVQLLDTDGNLATSYMKNQSLALGEKALLIFGPLKRPDGRVKFIVGRRGSDGSSFKQIADQCKLVVPPGSLDEFQGGDFSAGGVGLEGTDRLEEPTIDPFGPCGENEIYRSCGTTCPETCVPKPSRVCTFQCIQGCFCKTGYVRHELTGECITPGDCPLLETPVDPVTRPVVPMTTSPPAQSGCRQPALLNGNTLIVGSSGVGIEVGTVAYFLCDPGYKIDPASQVRQTCSESGTWTPVAVQRCIATVSAPVIRIEQLRIIGTCLDIPCSASGSPRPRTTWEFNDRPLPAPLRTNVRVLGSGTLRICNGLPEQAGRYKCVASNRGGTVSRVFPVFFGSKPVINREDLPQQDNLCISLPCRATGNPSPQNSWFRNGQRVEVDSRDYIIEGHMLKVCNGRPALAGVYECRARNSAGSDSRSYELAFNPVTAPTPAVVDPTPDIKDTIIASLQAQLARANRRYVDSQLRFQAIQRQLIQCQRNNTK